MGYGWEGEKVRLAPLDKGRHMEDALLWRCSSPASARAAEAGP